MRDIEHQTTIAIYSDDESCDKNSIIKQLKTIRDGYFGEKNNHYISCKVGNQWVNDCYLPDDIDNVKKEFDRFINFIDEYGYDKDDEYCVYDSEKEGYFDAGKDYLTPTENRIDVEDGDLEFENSFQLWIDHKEGEKEQSGDFVLYFGTDQWYADEEEELSDLGLGLAGDMNDTEGEYFEFGI